MAYLDKACRDCPHLRGEVEALLDANNAHSVDIETMVPLAPADQTEAETLLGGSDVHAITDDEVETRTSFAPADLPRSEDESADIGHIAGYRILDQLGVGGMGVVYEAEKQSPQRRVALKVVRGLSRR